MNTFYNKKLFLLITLIAFGAGIFLGGLLHKNPYRSSDLEYRGDTPKDAKLTFVSPLLECVGYEAPELKSFKETLEDFMDQSVNQGAITDASIYFRDLNNGLWLAINAEEVFTPASLLKVPLAMSYLKESELHPEVLDQKIVFQPGEIISFKQNYLPSKVVEPGREYAVRELLERMLIYSDNNAQRALYKMSTGQWRRVFDDLGIGLPEGEKDGDFILVKDYARFFRVLYNASYLSKENSNYLLNLLSQSEFKQGLSLGVPKSVSIAHKFGEREFGEIEQLHDCGVVYAQKSPYVLCIMSRGQDYRELSQFIGKISSLVYEEVSKQSN